MRAIWPEYDRAGVGFSFSLFGEPYLNLGFVGVFIFSMIFGILCRTLYAWFLKSPLNPAAIAIYALSWPFVFVYFRGGIGVDYHRQLIYTVPVLLAIFLAGVRRDTPPKALEDGPASMPESRSNYRAIPSGLATD